MKALFGVVSVLMALAIAGLLSSQEFKASAGTEAAGASAPRGAGLPVKAPPPGMPLEPRPEDITQALEQGAPRPDPAP